MFSRPPTLVACIFSVALLIVAPAGMELRSNCSSARCRSVDSRSMSRLDDAPKLAVGAPSLMEVSPVGARLAIGIRPTHCACSVVLTVMAVSIRPTANSSSQLPPSAVAPVRSTDAATSAPVRPDSSSTKARPCAPCATSQP